MGPDFANSLDADQRRSLHKYIGSELFLAKDFPLGVMRLKHPRALAYHQHDFMELVFIIAGQGVHHYQVVNSAALAPAEYTGSLMPGDVLALHLGEAHAYSQCENLRLYNLFFRPELIADEKKDLALLPNLAHFFLRQKRNPDAALLPAKQHLSLAGLAFAVNKLDLILDELVRRRPGFKINAKAYLLELLVYLSRLPDGPALIDGASTEAPGHQQAIARAIIYMEKNLAEKLTLLELARQAHLSQAYFCRQFKALTGVSPWHYLLRLRLEKSKSLLVSSNLSISEIAFESGFCDSSYLIKIFKKQENTTPDKFRLKAAPVSMRHYLNPLFHSSK
jgi:AraC family L-rhamnose operon transcriptional activator RhaR/AraC family L-rhamnose operon regulatory protein RhaS